MHYIVYFLLFCGVCFHYLFLNWSKVNGALLRWHRFAERPVAGAAEGLYCVSVGTW